MISNGPTAQEVGKWPLDVPRNSGPGKAIMIISKSSYYRDRKVP